MLHIIFSYPQSKIGELILTDFKKYCSQSQVCSEKSEKLCLIGLLDETGKLRTKFICKESG